MEPIVGKQTALFQLADGSTQALALIRSRVRSNRWRFFVKANVLDPIWRNVVRINRSKLEGRKLRSAQSLRQTESAVEGRSLFSTQHHPIRRSSLCFLSSHWHTPTVKVFTPSTTSKPTHSNLFAPSLPLPFPCASYSSSRGRHRATHIPFTSPGLSHRILPSTGSSQTLTSPSVVSILTSRLSIAGISQEQKRVGSKCRVRAPGKDYIIFTLFEDGLTMPLKR